MPRASHWQKTGFTAVACTIDGFTASEKLGTHGIKVVLNEDGTEIDDDGVLFYELNRDSILLLLCDGEEWTPEGGMHATATRAFVRHIRAVSK